MLKKQYLWVLAFSLIAILFAGSPVYADEIRGIGELCLDVKGGGGKGTPVIVWPCNGRSNQDWELEGRMLKTEDGLCLDVKGAGGQGNPVIVWTCHGRSNQQWALRKDGTIRSADGGLCLDVRGGKAVKGTEVIVWPCTGRANQKWE